MPDQKLPYLAPFDQKSEIVLTPAPNGGWVVTDKGKMGECDNILGAFSDATDMLRALSRALVPPDANGFHTPPKPTGK